MEVPWTLAEISFIVTCLYRLPLRRPSPLDRFQNYTGADMSIYQHFDILYVSDKFPRANPALVTRLGKLVTRRRQLLAFRSAHDEKLLSEDAGIDMKTSETDDKAGRSEVMHSGEIRGTFRSADQTIARSQISGSRQTAMTKATIVREERKSDGEQNLPPLEIFSEYAPSMASLFAKTLRVKIPRRPCDNNGDELQDFKCPYCFIVGHVDNRESWK